MRISSIAPYKAQIPFSSHRISDRKLEKGQFTFFGDVFNSGYTQYARDDMNWQDLGKYLKNRYPDISKADIRIFGCSTGEEPYTMAILLKHLYGDTPFIINAYDIDENAIKTCKTGQRNKSQYISQESVEKIKKRLDLSEKENIYFVQTTISPDILNLVEYKRANILTSLDTINPYKPSIIMARNMWPYIDSREYLDFAQKLFSRLSSGSVVIVGGYDIASQLGVVSSSSFPNILYRAGFSRLCTDDYRKMNAGTRYLIYEK